VLAALSGRRLVYLAPMVAVLLCLPSLGAGLQTEDFLLRDAARSAKNVFVNLFGSPGDAVWTNYRAKDLGALPWLTPDDWQVAFFRPLSSLLHNLEYQYIPDGAVVMHAHSLVWLAVLVLAAASLQRRLMEPSWAAGLAALFYAVDDGHGLVVGWLANRSALVAAALALLSLCAHDRYRRDGWRPGALLAPLLLALALLAGETALGVAGFFVAHALLVDPARLERRILAQLPWLSVVGTWAIAYRVLGYGAQGSGAYIDPAGRPFEFLEQALLRFPTLAFGLFGGPIDLLALVEQRLLHALLAGAIAFLLAALLLVVPALRDDRYARFWGLGTLLALIPACSAFPSERMLLVAGVGGSALMASFARALVERAQGLPRARAYRACATALAALWLCVHGPAAMIFLPLRSRGLAHYDAFVERAANEAFAGTHAHEQLIIVNTLDLYTGALMVGVRLARDEPLPAHTRVLYGGQQPVNLRRTDAKTLIVRPARGFMDTPTNIVFRSKDRPMNVGQGLQLTELQIVVTVVDADGMPLEIALRFAEALENAPVRIVGWHGDRYQSFELPAIGTDFTVEPRRVDPFSIWL
jgi:hypothetical protein